MQSENQEPWSQERGSRSLEDCVNLESVISYKSMCFDNGQKGGNSGLGLYYLWTFASRSYGERHPKNPAHASTFCYCYAPQTMNKYKNHLF